MLALATLFAADVWGMAEVERLIIVHGHHKDTHFWVGVALLCVVVVALIALTLRVALHLGSERER